MNERAELARLLLAVAVDHRGTRHLEAAPTSLTACGLMEDMDTRTTKDSASYNCIGCAAAVKLADELRGSPADLRILAGAALIAADKLDPDGATLTPEEATACAAIGIVYALLVTALIR